MKNVVFILLVCANLSSLALAAPDGKVLYQQHCASCHQLEGKGGVGVPLSLKGFLQSASDDYLFKTIRNGRPGRVMPAFQTLSDAQVLAIVSYIRSWSDKPAPVYDTDAVTGDVHTGKKLFAEHCAACHGADARGGKGTGVTLSRPRDLPIIAPSLANPGFLASASDKMIKHTLIKGREGTPMKSFIDQGLSEKQINDIVAYIRSLEKTIQRVEEASEPDAYLKYEVTGTIQETLSAIRQAVIGANFRIIREQPFEQGYVEAGKEDPGKVILYFCNFNMLNRAMAIDPRVGLFLPCRVTLIENQGKVQIITVNPEAISKAFNNDELNKICQEMTALYEEILGEASL